VKRIDAAHANPKHLWQEFGAPEYPSAVEVEQLKRASELVKEPQPWTHTQGMVTLETTLPPHGVASITLEFAAKL
jgi:Glycosyl hydrolases family 39